mmetsp:Transcript_22581/g.41587  ORF Transcript_22581/g.41587 Transcript_22581/m.41587 type:complete len:142 (-) Transcript_22581:115-540(-)
MWQRPQQTEHQTYVEKSPFETRCREAARVKAKWQDRVPVICERAPRSALPVLDKSGFCVPGSMTVAEFMQVVHKQLKQNSTPLTSDQTLYLFAGQSRHETTPKGGSWMSAVYAESKAEDGFLYIKYSAENTLGAMLLTRPA